MKSFCGGSRGAVFSKSAPWPPEAKLVVDFGFRNTLYPPATSDTIKAVT
jgi:hypothetical protein